VALLGVSLLGAGLWLVWPFWQLSAQLGAAGGKQPSRLYGRPFELQSGRNVDLDQLIAELELLGYRSTASEPGQGQFRRTAERVSIGMRPHPFAGGRRGAARIDIHLSGRRVAALEREGTKVEAISLEPPVLASYLGSDNREKRWVPLGQMPESLIRAVLAAEDAGFFSHAGLSLSGIARAAWVNLRGRSLQQGGSTLTQQLVKNLFLTHERTWARKIRELPLAVLVDIRYDKRAILETYLNEIYWGTDGAVNLMGVGSAAWAYFGKHPAELDLCESALLAAVIRSPGVYSPTRHPSRALERRNWVLDRMAERGWLEQARAERVKGEPLCHTPRTVPVRRAAYFASLAADEAARRFGLDPRRVPGLELLSTLEWKSQQAAQEMVAWGLESLENGWEKGRRTTGPLQAALVSIDPRSGAILAYVGGRDFELSQFDRASSALRQAGSSFKPVVYAAALERGTVSPVTLVEDSPITVALAGRRWTPRNSDEQFRGWVTVRTALEDSLNIPTVRIALATGLPETVETARALGITTPLEPVPALALGAFEVTPLELATVYATLAAGGVRRPAHALESVVDQHGRPVPGADLEPARQAVSEQTAYLVTAILQGVLDRGTATSVRRQGLLDPLAGKTGTTNDSRDSWFAGYSPDRATLVWVGYDDAAPTRLSGARAALPIWARFTWRVRPAGGFPVFAAPSGVTSAVIDPATGELATQDCPTLLTEVFLAGTQPTQVCRLHSSWLDWQPQHQAESLELERRRGPFRWLRKIFGGGKRSEARPDEY
jgi:penicillin-binding protein 1B